MAEKFKEGKITKIEKLESDVKALKDDVKKMAETLRNSKMLLLQLTKKEAKSPTSPKEKKTDIFNCDICGYKCENIITFNKHTNTKHKEERHPCQKCNKMFKSHDMLEEHIVKIHAEAVKYVIQESSSEVRECSLCEDTFLTNNDFKSHVTDNLKEIKGIDVEYLKSGHELFACNSCSFESNNPELIKNHLAEHTLTPKLVSTNIVKSKEEIKALLKTKDWHDTYDDFGNPLYETTDSEQSSEEKE